jgi:glutaconate CoA-transferase subunit A
MAGLTGSDLMRRFKTVSDPYTGQTFAAIAAIRPDWTILHVQEADEMGNIHIDGAVYDDILKAKAAAHVLATCERIIAAPEGNHQSQWTALPGFLVDAVVEVPGGAWPHACDGLYGYDEAYLREYLVAAGASDETYQTFVQRGLSR